MLNPFNNPDSWGYDPSLPIGYIHWEDDSLWVNDEEEDVYEEPDSD